MTERIKGDDLIAIGYPENHLIGLALKLNKKRNNHTREEMMDKYLAVLKEPNLFLSDFLFGKLAQAIIDSKNKLSSVIPLLEDSQSFKIYGIDQIEEGAIRQMEIAMKLPVSRAGALMPDAHQGYGLPIGGVLATHNAVIPYGVGVDIGCRMALSIFDLPGKTIVQQSERLEKIILQNTVFGAGRGFLKYDRSEHAVLENPLFEENSLFKHLKDKAWSQLGTSGGGNHFVEFGIIVFDEADEALNIPAGEYLALLTHSGSRGFGATIANHYTQLAKKICQLPHNAANLAYLDLDSEAGNDYWLAMNLAGDYASANHEIIHTKIKTALGANRLALVENHHNFAWKEMLNNEEVIVHRKGATPAGAGVLGIIPGSMATPGFLVRGKGAPSSIQSASHGAGRKMSRTQAIQTFTKSEMKKLLDDLGIKLLGSGLDEAPMAYKDIHQVMSEQMDLVDTIGVFHPKIVRMADDGSRED